MTFRVRTSAQAEHDAEAILEWLASQHAGQAAADWFSALRKSDLITQLIF